MLVETIRKCFKLKIIINYCTASSASPKLIIKKYNTNLEKLAKLIRKLNDLKPQI